MSQVTPRAWLCTEELREVGRDLLEESSALMSRALRAFFWKKADPSPKLTLFSACVSFWRAAWEPHHFYDSFFPRLNLFWDNLNVYIFVPTGSNRLNRTSFPVFIYLIDLQRIISPFLCYLFFHSPWLKTPVALSLCLEDRLLISLAVPVVSSHVFGKLSLAFYYYLP